MSKIIVEKYYPTVEANLKKNGLKLLTEIGGMLNSDGVSKALEQPHPGVRVFFSSGAKDADRSLIFNLCGIEKSLIAADIKKLSFIGGSWEIATNPFNWLMTLVIKFFQENKIPNVKQEDAIHTAAMLLAVHFYASLQYKFFNKGINDAVMRYAVNSLSKKFTLHNEGTMYATILKFVIGSHETYKGLISRADDKDLFDYLINLRTRMRGMVLSLKEHFEKVRKSGAYLNVGRDYYDDETHVDKDNDTSRILAMADTATEKFVSTTINQKVLLITVRIAGVPSSNLVKALDDIRENEIESVTKIFRSILELFTDETKLQVQDVRTKSFSNFFISVYSRSNTKDARVEEIKSILDRLLNKYSEFYRRTNREATKSNLRKAIYFYLGFFLQTVS